MSGGFPDKGSWVNAKTIAIDTANSRGATIAYASSNTKSSYVQLIASTAADIVALVITLQPAFVNAWGSAVDIAVGGAGSEVVVASNLQASGSQFVMGPYVIPVNIPTGTRISARAQGDVGPDTIYVNVTALDGSFTGDGFAGVDDIGFNSGTTYGTALPASGSANTVGAYAQLTASTAKDYAGFFYTFTTKGSSAGACLIDIAIGGAGSEQIILPQQSALSNNTLGMSVGVGPIWISIPAGTRIAARMQSFLSSGTTDLTLYGVYQ